MAIKSARSLKDTLSIYICIAVIITGWSITSPVSLAIESKAPLSILKRRTEKLAPSAVSTTIRKNSTHTKTPIPLTKKKVKQKNIVPSTKPVPTPITVTEPKVIVPQHPLNPKKLLHNIEQESITAVIEKNYLRTSISFLWDAPVGAAAFIKGNKLWLIFDRYATINFRDTSQVGPKGTSANTNSTILNFVQLDISQNATFIVAELSSSIISDDTDRTLLLYRHKNTWVIEAAPKGRKSRYLKLVSKPTEWPSATFEFITYSDVSNLLRFKDPFDGEDMSVATLLIPSQAVELQYHFVDFNVLKTIQGIAIEHNSDSLQVEKDKKIVRISSPYGLNTAPEILIPQDLSSSSTILLTATPNDNILDLKSFEVSVEKFAPRITLFNIQLLSTRSSQKARLKMDLAMFYLANSLYKEAQSMLKLVIEEYPILAKDYKVVLLGAVLHFLNRDFQSAYDLISSVEIRSVPLRHREEFRFWQSAISYKIPNSYKYTAYSNTLRAFSNWQRNFLQHYTQNIIQDLGFYILEQKIKRGSLESVYQVLDVLLKIDEHNKTVGVSPDMADMARIYRNRLYYDLGRYYTLKNQYNKAEEYFDKCINDTNDTLHYVRCQFRRALLLKTIGKINFNSFIDILERIRLVWRGDNFEIVLLQTLYEAYINNDEQDNALRIGKFLVENYPNTFEALRMSNSMSRLFINFFLEETQHRHNKDFILKALELFYEFQNLVPVGYLGDEIILRVADYLLDMDLLSKAAALLEHQVRNRLTGIKRERALNKLAATYIMNRQYTKALDTLTLGARYTSLPDFIANDRKYLHVEALYKSGNFNVALALLEDDSTQHADDIRAEIFWAQKDWRAFDDQSEPYLYALRKVDTSLSNKDLIRIMKQMISYLYLGKNDLLDDLYEDFKKRLPQDNKYTNSIVVLWKMSKIYSVQGINMEDIGRMYKLTSELMAALDKTKT